jgi:hypothetical protein
MQGRADGAAEGPTRAPDGQEPNRSASADDLLMLVDTVLTRFPDSVVRADGSVASADWMIRQG